MEFNSLKATKPLQGGSLLFTTKFPEIPDTHLIDLGRDNTIKKVINESVGSVRPRIKHSETSALYLYFCDA